MYREIRLKKGRERAVMNRHPWIFSGAAASLPAYENGEIVRVISSRGDGLGYGFFSPSSQIVCRLFEFTGEKISHFDASYFGDKIDRAAALRKNIISGNTDCYRLLNAEGDFFPGLTIDIYGNTAVLQVQIKGAELLLDSAADRLLDTGLENICVKNPGPNEVEGIDIPFGYIRGSGEPELTVTENGHRFIVDPVNGQKSGFFIDQRENRLLSEKLAAGRRVLNAFCYTGGFSVYTLAGEAESVTGVDISGEAVEAAEKNVTLNFGEVSKHKAVKGDCFEYLRSMETGCYNFIILDPPAFVKSSKGVERGARGYKDINLSAFKKCAPGSYIMTFSCSHHVTADLFRKIVFSAAADSGRDVRVIEQLSQGRDHPFSIYHPEGEYLKGLLLYVE